MMSLHLLQKTVRPGAGIEMEGSLDRDEEIVDACNFWKRRLRERYTGGMAHRNLTSPRILAHRAGGPGCEP
jgi:hypothetical protein